MEDLVAHPLRLEQHLNSVHFFVQEDGSLKLNEFSLNKVANVIFLESPVGVGYSYTNNSKDMLEVGDRVTATDSYAFLNGWFKRFPSFKSHDFYIAGESYAGHYAPQLADLIYEGNKHNKEDSKINLKGFMVGNAVTNDITDTQGMIEFAWTHAIISEEVYSGIIRKCDFTKQKLNKACGVFIKSFLESYTNIDIFNIYSPVCLRNSKRTPPPVVARGNLLTSQDPWHTMPSGYDPCAEDYLNKYFNNKDVQKALHANTTNLPYPYSPCSAIKWNDSPKTVLPVIQKLLQAGLRIWMYSGDVDGRVPWISSKNSIKKMDMKVKKEWRAWFDQHQVGGWIEVYEGNFTFVTVRGAGHQVPVDAPHQALSLFTYFLSSNSLPSSPF